MSLAQAPPDRGIASPLMSNNPFRNKVATSQAPSQPTRPISTNPFLDSNELSKESIPTVRQIPSDSTNGTTNLFSSMSINGPPRPPRSPQKAPGPIPNGNFNMPEQMPQRPTRGPSTSHRRTPSDEHRRQAMPVRRGTEMNVFADSHEAARLKERRSQRRNSESSVRDKPSSMDPEEERKRRERKSRDPRSGKAKPSRRLDVIDKLDVTSIYGTGLFHHDGPFDACNPNRNKKRHRYAPMQAFPKDSANMLIGGAGPVKPKIDYDKFHGYGQEAHIDFNEAAVVDEDAEYMRRPQPERSASFNPTARDTIHGEESAGLGTSTFLEGAPASRIAIERRESEMNEIQQQNNVGGLSRKKSLAQKLRGVRGTSNRVQSPDSDRPPNSPLPTGRSETFSNPFFKDYDKDSNRQDQPVNEIDEQAKIGRTRALSSPKPAPPLERQATSDYVEPPQESKPTGFLGRMKSLKKTKSRPEKRETS